MYIKNNTFTDNAEDLDILTPLYNFQNTVTIIL